MTSRFSKCLSALTVAAAALALSPTSQANDWDKGYVIAGVRGGAYNIYDASGTFIEQITDGSGGFTTGAYFLRDDNAPPGKLYTTSFGASNIVVYDGSHPHTILQTISVAANGGAQCESVVFDDQGRFYVGNAQGDRDIHRYLGDGTFDTKWDVATENVGADWIDLAADQCTMYHTSEGRRVMRYDVCTSTQLADFATLPNDGGQAFAFRLLPPFDGSAGMIVADRVDIKRLDSTGAVVQTYDIAGEDNFFAMNLDPDGTSFWAGDFGTDNFYKIDIASGNVLIGPINVGSGNTMFGLAVVGEISGGVNNPPIFQAPSPCGQTLTVDAGSSISYTVSTTEADASDTILLEVSGDPAGSTHTPALPIQGAADQDVTTVFDWTPGNGDIGIHVLTYTATDSKGLTTTCDVTIEVEGCQVTNFCNPSDGHPNNYAAISISGCDTAVSPTTVDLAGGPANKFVYLLIGDGSGIVTPFRSDGELCMDGGNCLGRYVLDLGTISGAGTFSTDISNSASGGANFGIPICGGNITAGQSWTFQYWHRQGAGQNSTLSEAMTVKFK